MAEQFSTPVRGSSGAAVSVAATGTIEVDNYQHGDAFSVSGSDYPKTVNPAETIQELALTKSADVVARITTTGGDTFDLQLNGTVGTWDKWSIDSVEFRDPNGTAAAVEGAWAGE